MRFQYQKHFLWFSLLVIFSELAFGDGQVSEVIQQAKDIKIQKDSDMSEGNTACIFHQSDPISCGTLTQCTGDICTLEIVEQVEDVMVGDSVKLYGSNTHPTPASKEEAAPPESDSYRVEKRYTTSDRDEAPDWDIQKAPQTRLEIVSYHRTLIRQLTRRRSQFDED